MERPGNGRGFRGGIEENTLAILDFSEDKDRQDADDDRLAFLEAVYAASFIPDNKTPPTYKMYEAVFQILRLGKPLELIMESYQLLKELDQHFPRVFVTKADGPETFSELTVIQEAWTPLVSTNTASSDKAMAGDVTGGPLDPSDFHLLIQDLVELADNVKEADRKSLRSMMLFQYLVSVLENDFLPRNRVFGETMNWILLRESLLNVIMVLLYVRNQFERIIVGNRLRIFNSRKINLKSLTKDFLAIICGLGQLRAINSDSSKEKLSGVCDTAVAIAFPEMRKTICASMQKLLIMIMELDTSRKKAGMLGHVTRADIVRSPLVEIILDELTYDKDILSPFLLVFKDPIWKLELIVQYLWKYITKTSVRTRRSNVSTTDDATFCGALKCISNGTGAKTTAKKIGAEEIQLLLAHGFLESLPSPTKRQYVEGQLDHIEQITGGSLEETCKNLVSAFNSLRRIDEQMEIISYAKEALFAAATILSAKP